MVTMNATSITVAAFLEFPYLTPNGMKSIGRGSLACGLSGMKRAQNGPAVDYLAVILCMLGVKRFDSIIVRNAVEEIQLLKHGRAHLGPANLYMTQTRYAEVALVDTFYESQESTLLNPAKQEVDIYILAPYELEVWIVGTFALTAALQFSLR